jgi:hypothetical protein
MSGRSTQIHRLGGIDAQNPLGFFSALGALRVLDELARDHGEEPPRLGFRDEGRQVAVIQTPHSLDELVTLLYEDARGQRGLLALSLCYGADGLPAPATEKDSRRDLKPAPAYAREYLEAVAAECARENGDPRSAALAGAFLSELIQDNNGNSKPTAFHFAAGQQQWLSMVHDLRNTLTQKHFEEALVGPWREHTAPSFAWDSSVSRMYALRATDPAKEKRGSIPGANWLGIVGLSFFPVLARNGRLQTTRVNGGWKDSRFVWPVWRGLLTAPVVRSLLRGDPLTLDSVARTALGVTQVFACRILRSDQGGYGSFTPADVLGPAR